MYTYGSSRLWKSGGALQKDRYAGSSINGQMLPACLVLNNLQVLIWYCLIIGPVLSADFIPIVSCVTYYHMSYALVILKSFCILSTTYISFIVLCLCTGYFYCWKDRFSHYLTIQIIFILRIQLKNHLHFTVPGSRQKNSIVLPTQLPKHFELDSVTACIYYIILICIPL